ncbi:Na/Pi cotransporter family protein [Clostridium sp. HBUAS56010]|uniref:Na/Pi cotransporter family protein n=1 Tax=Clostridium sp. HBUAS56010 TaxID=2571127 RepID=UPI0011780552|nr:Na/Pi cotransporter family protein [Clostridium sp. HBUAS56010]
MSMEDLERLIQFLGGLGVFLYGMDRMADGLQKSAAHKMQQFLGALTGNRVMGILMGTGITAIILSSSATTVMVVGFVNAGILNLSQAVGIIMGANVGTTVTSWIVSMNEWGEMLKPEWFSSVLIVAGALLGFLSKKEKRKQIGEVMVGFGLLFIGLQFMSVSSGYYRTNPFFLDTFSAMGRYPFLGILAGLLVTGLLQSSSVSVGILQVLALNGMVDWQTAVFINLGQNIGSCAAAIHSSFGANRTARQAAMIHLLFNVAGALIFGVIMTGVFRMNPVFALSPVTSVNISIFHTMFNVSNTIFLFPFAGCLVRLSGILVREDKQSNLASADLKERMKRHLDSRILETPSFAIESASHEAVEMGYAVLQNFDFTAHVLLDNAASEATEVKKMEQAINEYEKILTDYLIKISNQSLNEEQHLIVKNLFYMVSDFERISDHCENLSELALEKSRRAISFSREADKELEEMFLAVRSSLQHAIDARKASDMSEVRVVVRSEEIVDNLEEEFRERHIERLSLKICRPESGVIFLDALNNLERISDHAHNVAGYVREEM